MPPKCFRVIIMVIMFILVPLVLGCSFVNSGAGSEPDNNTNPGGDYYRIDNGEGGVQVSALFGIDKKQSAPVFKIEMNTHSGSLLDYPVMDKIVMQVDNTPVKPVRWDIIDGDSHHLSGNLVFPEKDSSGNPLIRPDSEVRLIIRDLRNVSQRVLTWDNPPARQEG